MKINKYIPTLLASTLLCSLLLFGCKQEESKLVTTINEQVPEETIYSTESAYEEFEAESESIIEETTEPTSLLLLTITIKNQCGADIGMFSVIDPVTNEQVNVGGIVNGESLSIQAKWPVEITDFQWAIYNINGELYTESTTNISQAKESVIITLQGEGAIDTIDTTFQ